MPRFRVIPDSSPALALAMLSATCALAWSRPARSAEDAAPAVLVVLDFTNKLESKEKLDFGRYDFAEQVRHSALDLPKLRPMTREVMQILARSHPLDLQKCEGPCEVEMGRKLLADLVVAGELVKSGAAVHLRLRVYETHGSRLLSSRELSATNPRDLARQLGDAVPGLFSVAPETHAMAPSEAAPIPAAGYLTVRTRPRARVRIDGGEVGTTPLRKHAVPPGRHEVVLEAKGFESVTRTVDVAAGTEAAVDQTFSSKAKPAAGVPKKVPVAKIAQPSPEALHRTADVPAADRLALNANEPKRTPAPQPREDAPVAPAAMPAAPAEPASPAPSEPALAARVPPTREQSAGAAPIIVRQPSIAGGSPPPYAAGSHRTWTWVAGGAAVVALGASGLFALQANSTASEITGSPHPRAQVEALQAQYLSQTRRANIFLGIGGGLAALSATFFVLRF